MAEVGDLVNLRDLAANTVGDNIGDIINTLAERNEVLEDILWQQANQRTKHLIVRLAAKPSGDGKRLINEATSLTKSAETQVEETMAIYERRSAIDQKLVEMAADPMKFRSNKDSQHVSKLGEDFASDLFYGNESTNIKDFNGFMTRLATPSATLHSQGAQLVDGGGTGSTNTSIVVAGWGEYLYGIYPQGSQTGGIGIKDNGIQEFTDTDSGGRISKYETKVTWDAGIACEDYHYLTRIANIDVTALTKTGSTGAQIDDLLLSAIARTYDANAIYVNLNVYSYFLRQLNSKGNNFLTMERITSEDRMVMMFAGIPIRRCDAILNTEDAVTGTFFNA
jgi:hypothetical protein